MDEEDSPRVFPGKIRFTQEGKWIKSADRLFSWAGNFRGFTLAMPDSGQVGMDLFEKRLHFPEI
jgi:hypothetical protein